MAFEVSTGTVLAGFRVLSPIGDGATGTVYLAESPDGSRVALKVLAPELARDERFRQRFLQESRLASGLDNPHIVPTLTSGEEDGLLYLAMAYVEGSDLRQILRAEHALAPERALDLVRQAAEGLDRAHAAGLIHRDVKPANILVAGSTQGEHAWVCDFGLARHISSVSSLTGDRGFVGTIDYVSPEQIEGGSIDHRADVYSLACVLYEAIGGVRPFERESELSVVYAHLIEAAAPITHVKPELPSAMNDVFATALAKSPDDRYATCGELVEAARAALRGELIRQRPGNRALVGALALAVAVGATGVSLLVLGGGASSQHPPSTQGARAIQPNSVALVSARTEHVIRLASFKSTPSDVVFGRRSAWILLRDQQLVNRVDPATGRITGHVPLPFVPSRMVADGDSAWVTEESGPHIAEVGTRRGSRVGVRKVLSVPTAGPRLSSPAGIAVGAGSLWVARGAHIARVDPRTGRVLKLFPAPVTSNWVVFAGGSVWAASGDSGRVIKIDPVSGSITRQSLHGWISDLAVGGGFVWVPVVPSDVVYKLSVDDLSVQGQVASGGDPESVSVGGGGVWVANTTRGAITRIDIATGAQRAVTMRAAPQVARYRDGVVWAAAAPAPPRLAPVSSGQEIRIPLSRDIGSLDPPLPQDADRWQRDYATCSTLLNYPDSAGPAGLRLRPEIAASMPAVSPDGRTYTFHIRQGFRFSPPSGQLVTAETFRYTLERAFSPAYGHGSPAMQLLADIVGATAYNAKKTPHISGISVRGNTLSIRLRAPVGALANRLAEAFFCPVPIGTPVAPGGLTRPIPTAGPYYVASSALGQTVLLRNPNYHGMRPRQIERIVYTSSIPSAKAVALVDRGAAEFIDGYTTDADPGSLTTSSAAARNKSRYVVVPVPFIDAIAFNAQRALFRDARMRRAVNFAIDRRALAAVFDEPPTDRYIPPAISGLRTGHVYPLDGPNLAKAKRLIGRGRHRAVLYSCGPPVNVTPGPEQIIRANLARIGIDVQIKRSLGCLNGPDTKRRAAADMALVSVGDDWGDPLRTIKTALGRSPEAMRGYWNDPVLRRRLELAESLRGEARIRAFAKLEETLVRDAAPFAPYGFFTSPEYFSPQVGCRIFQATYHFVDLGALCVRKA